MLAVNMTPVPGGCIETIVRALNESGVRYLIAGGLAVVAHGYVRFTAEGLTVFSLFSTAHPATEIDLFVEAPLDFSLAHSAAYRVELAPGLAAPFVGFEDLLALKRRAGRPLDLQDIARLTALRREPPHA
jgi:hypothetical protein